MTLKIIALGLMAIFYACYFSKVVSQKKRGICTDQLGKGKEGLLKFIEITLKIATYILPILQIISILFYFEDSYYWLRIAGVVIELFGIVVFFSIFSGDER